MISRRIGRKKEGEGYGMDERFENVRNRERNEFPKWIFKSYLFSINIKVCRKIRVIKRTVVSIN